MSTTDVRFDSASTALVAEEVSIDNLVARAKTFFESGYRFITATCLDRGDYLEVLYHFDKEVVMSHLRLAVPKGQEVPSISSVYLCAFIIENEMKELFGMNVTGLAVDYQGHMLLSEGSPKLPLLKTERTQDKTADAGGR
jgi:NADH:ubiquinone oxidoreductase subunit C